MNQRAISNIIAAVIGVPLLIVMGIWSATEPLFAGICTGLVVGVIVLSQLGTRCWLLIPFFMSFDGSLNILPGSFAPRDLAVGLVTMVLPIFWVVRRFPIKLHFGSVEIALFALLATVAQAFVRNPAGLSILGSGTVGGRPYFEIAVAVVAFVILSVLIVDLKSVRSMIYMTFAGSIVGAVYETIAGVFPSIALYAASIYSTSTTSIAVKGVIFAADPNQGAARLMYLARFSKPIMTLVLAFRSPLRLLAMRNIGFLMLAVFAGVCMLLSGFRSGIAGLGLMGIAACFLHRRPMELFILGTLGGPILAIVLVLQGSVIELPLPAQRALSFLPADWDLRAVRAAEGSSEWRFEMWREALTSDRYIRNKWMGDGFGFTSSELDYQWNSEVTGMGGTTLQEYYLMTGTYHSGPVETIKRTGYLGLAVLLIVMVVFFREAVSLVNRARGTPYFTYAMFIALPVVIHPFMFVFVFGAFKETIVFLLFSGGMLRLMMSSFQTWRREQSIPIGVGPTQG